MNPALGEYMVTKTGGWFAWAIRKATRSSVNHAAVYVGHGFIVEAEPHGAKVSQVRDYPHAIWSKQEMTVHTRLRIIECALNLVGTPYNFFDIAAQALVRFAGWKAPDWAIRRLSSAKRLQCAQLVDIAYEQAGVKLFKDGRPEGLVSPGDLLNLMTEK